VSQMSRRDQGLATAASVAVGLAGQAALMISGPLVARMLGADGWGQLAAALVLRIVDWLDLGDCLMVEVITA
jgi:O-antigen/teichoic acid export membrane protein